MMLQLNPPLPVKTPKGKAWAHVLLDYGMETDLIWVCFQDNTGECWSWPNKDIRIQENMTLGAIRRIIDKVNDPDKTISLLKEGPK